MTIILAIDSKNNQILQSLLLQWSPLTLAQIVLIVNRAVLMKVS